MSAPQNILIFHYHFLRGGVRSSIHRSLMALHESGWMKGRQVRLLTGKEDGVQSFLKRFSLCDFHLEAIVDARLDYRDEPWPDERSFREQVSDLARWFLTHGRRDTLFWLHNATLGKNALVTAAWAEAARVAEKEKAPFRFLYHIHDFAECGRPENLLRLKRCWKTGGITDFYPVCSNVAYAVLNSTDREAFLSAGVSPERVFYLPNVVLGEEDVEVEKDPKERLIEPLQSYARREGYFFAAHRPWWVLPIRLIRRKNVMESLAVAALSPRPVQLLLSLDATSSQEKLYAETVKAVVKQWHLPMVIGFGVELVEVAFTLKELMQAAEAIATTSFMEGFGFTFLDPPMYRKPLVGRDIPDVTRDFHPIGFPRDDLYQHFWVPVSAKTRERLSNAGKAYAQKQGAIFNIELEVVEAFMTTLANLFESERVDFGLLDLEAQVESIAQLKDAAFVHAVQEMNPNASSPACFPPDFTPRLLERLGPQAHAVRVRNIFSRVFALPTVAQGSKDPGDHLLNRFFTPFYQRALLGGWQ